MRRILIYSLIAFALKAHAQQQQDSLPQGNVLQEQVVRSIKANVKMPITQITLTQKQLEEKYYGADIPTLLNATPSINSYSDNGTGIGYSYFRLRGLDQSRINCTLNGIPVNDQEGQGTYFNNFADLISSASSIQLQRGVGTSTNGTASIAGSLNITTKALSEHQSFALSTGFGSFNSRKLTAEFQTGLIEKKFAFYGRIGDITTDGYRQHSGSHIRSLFLSAGYFGKKSVLKFNILSGNAESKLSYTGIDQVTLDASRTTNTFVNNERDAFNQSFYQLQYSYQLNPNSTLHFSSYYVHGNAPRFQYYLDGSYNTFAYMNMPDAIIGTDTLYTTDAIGSYRLNQHFYGGFANYTYTKGKVDFTTGIHMNAFVSEHFMEVDWARVLPVGVSQNHLAYFNTGYKNELNAFAKLTYSFTDKLSGFTDLQIRNASFTYKGKDQAIHRDTFSVEDMNWIFFNPKIGLRYSFSERLSMYTMFGITSREPTRSDYFLDEYPHQPIKQNDLKPEQVYDLEIGASYQNKFISLQANIFNMTFNNQLINTGQLNAVGTPITTNISSSVRRGFELDFVWKPMREIWVTNSSALMSNAIQSYTQYFDSAGAYITSVGINYKNVSAALTPSMIINQGIRYLPTKSISVELNGRYVSKQYLDNTQDELLKIKSFYFVDARIAISLKSLIKAGEPLLSIQLNNITNELYTPSGNTTGNVINYSGNLGMKSSTALYFPSATRNFFVTLTWKF